MIPASYPGCRLDGGPIELLRRRRPFFSTGLNAQGDNRMNTVSDTVSAPLIGAAYGGLGVLTGQATLVTETFTANTLWYTGMPARESITKKIYRFKTGFMWSAGGSGLTIGNTIMMSETAPPSTFFHELHHIVQGNVLGPAYLPSHIAGAATGIIMGGGAVRD